MSFAARELSVLAYANGFTLWHYRTGADDLLGSGYFNSAQELLREGDQIIANTARHSHPGILNLVVTRVDDSGGRAVRLTVRKPRSLNRHCRAQSRPSTSGRGHRPTWRRTCRCSTFAACIELSVP